MQSVQDLEGPCELLTMFTCFINAEFQVTKTNIALKSLFLSKTRPHHFYLLNLLQPILPALGQTHCASHVFGACWVYFSYSTELWLGLQTEGFMSFNDSWQAEWGHEFWWFLADWMKALWALIIPDRLKEGVQVLTRYLPQLKEMENTPAV